MCEGQYHNCSSLIITNKFVERRQQHLGVSDSALIIRCTRRPPQTRRSADDVLQYLSANRIGSRLSSFIDQLQLATLGSARRRWLVDMGPRSTIVNVVLTTFSLLHAVVTTNANFYGTITASKTFNGSSLVDTSPLTSFAAPKLDSINASNWDEWYFDGISEDGSIGLSILFARDATLSRWDLPNLRVSLDCVWSNGTKFTTMMFANTSSVLEHEGIITGEWSGRDWNATFLTDTNRNTQKAHTREKEPMRRRSTPGVRNSEAQ